MTEPISLSRDCDVIEVPSGEAARLARGTRVRVMQSQGGSFTLTDDRGGMHRLDERDADAIGRTIKAAQTEALQGSLQEKMIWDELKTIFDPEIPVNIVDLGLVYSMDVEKQDTGYRVNVAMTLTAPGCGMGPAIAEDARSKVLLVPGVSEADVRITWDPPWNQSMISEEGKMKLGLV